ncbi:hypothetical protein IEO21_10511 [Rhodonia placenta]|uniref:Uncharacterized protein n=1 Tax=Rhodonia placenta TaxID=104341 RepID=A0A8H7NSE1_9APHY|nr:hypothetical protein IEO21_10511 [Postia placenta]
MCARREDNSGGISDGCAEEGHAVPGCSAADGGGRDKERGVAHHTMPLHEAVERDATGREMARTSSTGAGDGARRDGVIERARSTARDAGMKRWPRIRRAKMREWRAGGCSDGH